MAVAMIIGTATTPEHYERYLLPRYQRGQLRLKEVENLLDVSFCHVRYHRRAVGPHRKRNSRRS